MRWNQSLEKRINSYRLQYWTYAILNKEFGRNLKFVRDSLHSRYEVNRHGFSIHTSLEYLEVVRYMCSYLQKCGYVPDEANQKDMTSQSFVKTTKRVTGEEKLYISMSYGKNMKGEKSISIYPRAYWHLYPKK